MLVLGRRIGESVRIGDGVQITVLQIQGNRVKLGIKAPKAVRVLRGELELEEEIEACAEDQEAAASDGAAIALCGLLGRGGATNGSSKACG